MIAWLKRTWAKWASPDVLELDVPPPIVDASPAPVTRMQLLEQMLATQRGVLEQAQIDEDAEGIRAALASCEEISGKIDRLRSEHAG